MLWTVHVNDMSTLPGQSIPFFPLCNWFMYTLQVPFEHYQFLNYMYTSIAFVRMFQICDSDSDILIKSRKEFVCIPPQQQLSFRPQCKLRLQDDEMLTGPLNGKRHKLVYKLHILAECWQTKFKVLVNSRWHSIIHYIITSLY